MLPTKQSKLPHHLMRPLAAEERKATEALLLAAGFVLLSAAVGAICFFFHIGKGGIQKRQSASSGGTKR